MSLNEGSIEVVCDAPLYSVVQACAHLGFRSPEDVRWIRMSEAQSHPGRWPGVLSSLRSHLFGGARPPAEPTCSCGQALPAQEMMVVVFNTGEEVIYRMGQCSRCRTMYWDEG